METHVHVAVAFEGDWTALRITGADLEKEKADGTLWKIGDANDGKYDDGLDSYEADTFAQFERLQTLYGAKFEGE